MNNFHTVVSTLFLILLTLFSMNIYADNRVDNREIVLDIGKYVELVDEACEYRIEEKERHMGIRFTDDQYDNLMDQCRTNAHEYFIKRVQ